MEARHCPFCANPLLPDATRCSVCGQAAGGPAGAAGVYVPSVPRPARVRVAPAGLLGAIMMAVGVFLPWYTLSLSFLGVRTHEVILGYATGGLLILPLALLLGLFSVLASTSRRGVTVGCAGLALLLGLYYLVDLLSIDDELVPLTGPGGLSGSGLGVGLYLVLAGALIALAGGLRGRT